MTSFNIDDFRKADRRWDLEALITWGNMNTLLQLLENVEVPQLRWAYERMSEQFEDEIGYGDYLVSNNENIAELIGNCKFASGKELTGKLKEWIMNFENEYQR